MIPRGLGPETLLVLASEAQFYGLEDLRESLQQAAAESNGSASQSMGGKVTTKGEVTTKGKVTTIHSKDEWTSVHQKAGYRTVRGTLQLNPSTLC